ATLSDWTRHGTCHATARLWPRLPGPNRPPTRDHRRANAKRLSKTGSALEDRGGNPPRTGLPEPPLVPLARPDRFHSWMARRSYVISRPTVLLDRRGVDFLEQVKEVPGNGLLHDLIEHPAQFAPDRSLSRPRSDRLFP